MTPAELRRDLGTVPRTRALAADALERLALSLGEPQGGSGAEDGPTVGRLPIPVCTCRCCVEERARGERP